MCDELCNLLKQREQLFLSKYQNWHLDKSSISGLGVFASKNFEAGEIIFKDTPIVLGPRSSTSLTSCVSCMKVNVPLDACSKGCRLPVCYNGCEKSASHEKECDLIRSFLVKEEKFWSSLLYRALTVFRCLLINSDIDKKILQFLHRNRSSNHAEIIFLKKELQKNFSEEEETYLSRCSAVLNGTAFETEFGSGSVKASLRGLYPLAGMMNHSCVPCTQHYYLSENNVLTMCVAATCFISQGTEITTSYSYLLWPTILRRNFLFATKEFWCNCNRCRDPTEFGTNLSALECSCGELILPRNPLDNRSAWKCRICSNVIPASQLPYANPSSIMNDDGKISASNVKYLLINEKINNIWKLGHRNSSYKDLSIAELNYKEQITRELLTLNNGLKLGNSRTKGLLSLELYHTLKEKKNRKFGINEEELFSVGDDAKKILNMEIDQQCITGK